MCFTVNNYSEDHVSKQRKLVDQGHCKYIVFGYEKGKENTPHLQGFVQWGLQMRYAAAQALLGGKQVWLATTRGTAEQAAAYCKKEGRYEEFGEMIFAGNPGGKKNFEEVKKLCQTGTTMDAVAACSNSSNLKAIPELMKLYDRKRTTKPEVIWLWGPTGVGKSRAARDGIVKSPTGDYYVWNKDRAEPYVKNTGTRWWCGYDRDAFVIVDDFRDSWWSLTYMLTLLDRYCMALETKGSSRQIIASTIVITSAHDPATMYASTGECIQQLLRRIDHVIQCPMDLYPEVLAKDSQPDKQPTDTEAGHCGPYGFCSNKEYDAGFKPVIINSVDEVEY